MVIQNLQELFSHPLEATKILVRSHLQKRILLSYTFHKRQLLKKIPEKIVIAKLIYIQRNRQRPNRYVVNHSSFMHYLTCTHCQKTWCTIAENKVTIKDAEAVSTLRRWLGKGIAIRKRESLTCSWPNTKKRGLRLDITRFFLQ